MVVVEYIHIYLIYAIIFATGIFSNDNIIIAI